MSINKENKALDSTLAKDEIYGNVNSLLTRVDTLEAGGGSGAPILQSPNGTLWQIGVNNSGALQTTQVAEGTPGTLHIFSPDNTEWNVTVTNEGALSTTAI